MNETNLAQKQDAPAKPVITSLADADRALEAIGRLLDKIEVVEAREREIMRQAQERIKKETGADYAELRAIEEQLEKFTRGQRSKALSEDQRSIELRFGKIGLRFTPWKLELLEGLKETDVIKKLKALKLKQFIHSTESINRQALVKIEDEKILKKYGLKRSHEEIFIYKLTPHEPAEPAAEG